MKDEKKKKKKKNVGTQRIGCQLVELSNLLF